MQGHQQLLSQIENLLRVPVTAGLIATQQVESTGDVLSGATRRKRIHIDDQTVDR